MKRLVKSFLAQFRKIPWYKWILLIYSGLIIFLIAMPLLLLTGFIVGIAKLENPFKSAIQLVNEVC